MNIITLMEEATEQTRYMLGVTDDVGAGEERGRIEIIKVDGRIKTEGMGVAEESVSRASIRRVHIRSTPISERKSSKIFSNVKLRSSIGFGKGLTNAGAAGVLVSTAELNAEVISDWGN